MQELQYGNSQVSVPEAVVAIRGAHRIVLLSHEMPDLDALASCTVIGAIIEELGLPVLFLTDSPMGEKFDYLPGIQWLRDRAIVSYKDADWVSADRLHGTADVALVLDAANLNQLGAVYKVNASALASATVINVDHHRTNTYFGVINVVRPDVSSTCELVADLAREMGRTLDPWMAEALLTGLIADTSRFSTANVSSTTLRNAAELMDRGANLIRILGRMSEPVSGPQARLWQTLLARLAYRQDRQIAFLDVTTDRLQQLGATENDLTGLANYMRGLQGVMVALIFVLRPGGIKISLRGKPGIDVGSVALKFGGGGHLEAAGCVVEGKPLEQLRGEILEEVAQVLSRATAPPCAQILEQARQ